jgi:hypothetical protein
MNRGNVVPHSLDGASVLQLAARLWPYLFCVVGIFIAVVRWRRRRFASLLIIGAAILLGFFHLLADLGRAGFAICQSPGPTGSMDAISAREAYAGAGGLLMLFGIIRAICGQSVSDTTNQKGNNK